MKILNVYTSLCFVFASSTIGGGSVAISFLVLVFAATPKEMALRPILFDPKNKMSKLSMYMSKLTKIRMDYSRHGIYTCDHVQFTLFSLLS